MPFDKEFYDGWTGLTDSERAPFHAQHITKHVETFLFFRREYPQFVNAANLADVIGCSKRHARRILESFAAAGYVTFRRGSKTSTGVGPVSTTARLKKKYL